MKANITNLCKALKASANAHNVEYKYWRNDGQIVVRSDTIPVLSDISMICKAFYGNSDMVEQGWGIISVWTGMCEFLPEVDEMLLKLALPSGTKFDTMKTRSALKTILPAVFLSASLCAMSQTVTGGHGQIIQHDAYTVRYNDRTLCPDWVTWELLPEEVTTEGVSRTDAFAEDPDVKGVCASPMDYSRNGLGLDRGHMIPAADNKTSLRAMQQSFYMSNVCPQDHNLNEGEWCELEKQCRFWCKHYYKTALWIACGPLFGDRPKTIGNNRVSVPSGFWKAVCRYDKFKKTYVCIAFLFDNAPCTDSYREHAVSVDEVESLTGLDLFGFLEDDVEERAEKSADLENWK